MVARTALAIVLVGLGIWIGSDFLPALGWAAILAIALWPLYSRFTTALGQARSAVLAPLIFSLLVGLILFLPVGLVAQQLAQQAGAVLSWIGHAREAGIAVPPKLAQLPIAADSAEQWWRRNLADPAAAAGWFNSINMDRATEWTRALGGELLHRAFMFLVCLLAVFAFLRDGHWIARRVLDTADRVFGDPGERLAGKLVDAVRGTVNGTVVVAVAEGLLIGAAYVLAGVPNAALFTVLTIAFAMVPFGAWAAFTGAAVLLLLNDGSVWAAAGVVGWGAVVMLAGDNFVWPALVGNAARLPFLFALVGVFGGLQVLGLIGLFVGPVVMASLLTIWREWVIGAYDSEEPTPP
jgi:predicted PurR-regulated permease PerM